MRLSRRLMAALGLGLTLSPAWATAINQATLTVWYSTSVAGVPISAPALGILALLLGVLAYAKLRPTGRGLNSLLLFALVVCMGALYVEQSSHAAPAVNTVVLSSGNPASSTGGQGIWVITNNLSQPATLTTVAATLNSVSVPWFGYTSHPNYPACTTLPMALAAGASCALVIGAT